MQKKPGQIGGKCNAGSKYIPIQWNLEMQTPCLQIDDLHCDTLHHHLLLQVHSCYKGQFRRSHKHFIPRSVGKLRTHMQVFQIQHTTIQRHCKHLCHSLSMFVALLSWFHLQGHFHTINMSPNF